MRWLALLWKAYLIAWIGLRATQLSARSIAVPSLTIAAYLALAVVGFVPLVGFILEKPFLRPVVWRLWLLFALCWALFDLIYFAEWFAGHSLGAQITGIALAVPSYLAVYVYARPSSRAWAVRVAA